MAFLLGLIGAIILITIGIVAFVAYTFYLVLAAVVIVGFIGIKLIAVGLDTDQGLAVIIGVMILAALVSGVVRACRKTAVDRPS